MTQKVKAIRGCCAYSLFIDLAARVYDSEQPLKDKADLFDRYIDRQLSPRDPGKRSSPQGI